MSTIKSSAEDLTLNADGSGNDIIFQSNGSNVATLDQAGLLTATTFAGSGASLTGVLPLAGGTMTGNIVGGDTTVSAVNLKDFGIVNNAIGGTGGGTQDIDLTLGNSVSATVDTSANTFTFSNPTASDELCIFSLVLTNGGSQTVNFPASVDWEGGTAPTLTTAGVDILVFATVDGGTNWHGQSYSLDSKTPS